MSLDIEHLEDLLGALLGSNKKVTSSTVSPLTEAGNNYGGILLKVDIIVENTENGVQEELHTVAKLIPRNVFMQQVLNVQVTCKKEIAFYDEIIPTLQRFVKQQECCQVMDIFPKMYGARINLNGSDVVDKDAVLLLENLVQSGYDNVDRLVGFDLPTAKLILKNLAAFHAVPLALKLTSPEIFERQIKPHLRDQFPQGGVTPRIVQLVMVEYLEDCDECKNLIPVLRQILERPRVETPEERDEPWLTIGHGDMWVNNIMVKFDDGRPVGVKFIDFQNFAYRSPAVDVFLFLWSSVQDDVLEESLDDLIKTYHEEFVGNLQHLGCNTEQFSLESLLEEMKIAAKYGIPQALFMMTFVVFCKKGGFSVDQDSSSPPELGTKEDVTAEAKEKVVYMVKKCNERGWLY